MRTHIVIAFAALTSLLIPSHTPAQPAGDTSASSPVGPQHAVALLIDFGSHAQAEACATEIFATIRVPALTNFRASTTIRFA